MSEEDLKAIVLKRKKSKRRTLTHNMIKDMLLDSAFFVQHFMCEYVLGLFWYRHLNKV